MSDTEFNLSGLEEALRRHLPQYAGSIITDDLIRVVRAGASWGEHVKQTLQQELYECLQQDMHLLPSREQVQQFIQQVGELQHELERIEQRIDQLLQGDNK